MRKVGLAFIAVLVLALAGIVWNMRRDTGLPVKVTKVEQGPIYSYIKTTGIVTSEHETPLSILTAGRIVEIYVKESQFVNRGTVLARLDGRDAMERLLSAEALLRVASDEVRQNRRNVEALRSLWKAGGESYQSVLDAETALQSSLAHESKALADVNLAHIARSELNVLAPFDGIVTRKEAHLGQLAQAGNVLFVLSDRTDRQIKARIDTGDVSLVKTGQTVEVSSDAFPDKVWDERIVRLDPTIRKEGMTSDLGIWISLGPNVPPLRLGQQVDVKVRTATRAVALQLPFEALINRGDKTFVAKIQSGRVHFTPVVTGVENLTHAEILQGAGVGEQIIVSEGKPLKEGDLVKPILLKQGS